MVSSFIEETDNTVLGKKIKSGQHYKWRVQNARNSDQKTNGSHLFIEQETRLEHRGIDPKFTYKGSVLIQF